MAFRWIATRPGQGPGRTGIDLMSVRAGLITEVWSVNGERALRPS